MAAEPPPPVHVLMAEPVRAKRKRRDFLARRGRAFGADDEWDGASKFERSLVGLCHEGVVEHEMHSRFVVMLTLHCHSVQTRALALAVLERTVEADALDKAELESRNKKPKTEETPGTQIKSEDGEAMDIDEGDQKLPANSEDAAEQGTNAQDADEPGSNDTPLKSEGEMNAECGDDQKPPAKSDTPTNADEDQTAVPAWSPKCVKVNVKPPRMQTFCDYGGLKILSRWLTEAGTPRTVAARQTSSATGILLLDLIEFLESMPVDLTAVRKSKINRTISRLDKQLRELPHPNRSHVLAGGLKVKAVLDALRKLKDTWKLHIGSREPVDPFASIQGKLQDRMNELAKHNLETSAVKDLPKWLAKVKKAQVASLNTPAKQRGRKLSLKEREKLEHEKEKARLMKKDLEETQKQRAALLEKLRKLEKKNTENVVTTTTNSSVRWKDGGSSKRVNRDVLEEVFVFDKDDTAATRRASLQGGVESNTAVTLE